MGDLAGMVYSMLLSYGTDVFDAAENMLESRRKCARLERELASLIAENTQLRQQFGVPPRLRLVTRPHGRES